MGVLRRAPVGPVRDRTSLAPVPAQETCLSSVLGLPIVFAQRGIPVACDVPNESRAWLTIASICRRGLDLAPA